MSGEEAQLLGPTRRAAAYFTAILSTAGTLLATSSSVWSNPLVRSVGAFSFACVALWVLYDTQTAVRRPRGVNNARLEPMFSDLEVAGARTLVAIASVVVVANVVVLGNRLPDPARIRRALEHVVPVPAAASPTSLDQKLLQSNQSLIDSLARGMNTVLVGPPGSGKSTLLRAIRRRFDGATATLDFSAAKRVQLSESMKAAGVNLEVPTAMDGVWTDVSGKTRAFGSLPGLSGMTPNALRQILGKSDSVKVVILDGLDEISKSSLAEVWSAADMFVRSSPSLPRLILVGRPEAFPQFMAPVREPTDDVRQRWPLIYEIQPIEIGSSTELDSALASYLTADRSPLRRLRITRSRADTIRSRIADVMWGQARVQPWIRESISTPYGLRILSELCLDRGTVRSDWAANARRLQLRAFDLCIKRAMESHNRPTTDVAVYRDAIRDIAVRYAPEVREDGTFRVGPLDEIAIRRDGKPLGIARVADILDRSGLAYVKPLDSDERQYRFFPLWLHDYLVWEYNRARVGSFLAEQVWLPRLGLAISSALLLLSIALVVESRGSRLRRQVRSGGSESTPA